MMFNFFCHSIATCVNIVFSLVSKSLHHAAALPVKQSDDVILLSALKFLLSPPNLLLSDEHVFRVHSR